MCCLNEGRGAIWSALPYNGKSKCKLTRQSDGAKGRRDRREIDRETRVNRECSVPRIQTLVPSGASNSRSSMTTHASTDSSLHADRGGAVQTIRAKSARKWRDTKALQHRLVYLQEPTSGSFLHSLQPKNSPYGPDRIRRKPSPHAGQHWRRSSQFGAWQAKYPSTLTKAPWPHRGQLVAFPRQRG